EKHTGEERGGKEHIDQYPPHIEKKVADFSFSAEGANDGRKGAESHRGGNELVTYYEEDLSKVRKMNIAGVVLQVGIRHERGDGVKDCRGCQHAQSAGIQRHDGLQCEHQVTPDE